jgi:hypothetical protein
MVKTEWRREMEELWVLLVMMTNPDVAKRVRNWKGRAAVYI